MSMEEVITEFNTTFLDMLQQLSSICPIDIPISHYNFVKNVINTTKNKIMDMYVLYVFPHRDKIEEGKDEFFLEENFIEDDTILKKVLTYKNIWKKLTEQNKQIIIQFLTVLNIYASSYLKIKMDMNK